MLAPLGALTFWVNDFVSSFAAFSADLASDFAAFSADLASDFAAFSADLASDFAAFSAAFSAFLSAKAFDEISKFKKFKSNSVD